MDKPREPLFTPDAGKLVGKAVGLTQSALASEAGQAVRAVIAKGQDGLMEHLSKAAAKQAPNPLSQARVLLAEQGQNFDTMRSAIGKIGESLELLNRVPADQQVQAAYMTALLNAQAEAIQGLTLLVLKGQQVQTELANAMDGQSRSRAPAMPKWVYYAMGGMMIWSLLTMLVSTIF